MFIGNKLQTGRCCIFQQWVIRNPENNYRPITRITQNWERTLKTKKINFTKPLLVSFCKVTLKTFEERPIPA